MASPSGRRRPELRPFLALAAYLVVAVPICPAFFLGPLSVLLLISRPSTAREWLWIGLCAGALAAWFRLPDSLSQDTVRAGAVFFTGAFVALTLAGVTSLSTRGFMAVIISAALTAAWFAVLHLRFSALEQDFQQQMWQSFRAMSTSLQLPAAPPPVTGNVLDALQSDSAAQRVAGALASTAAIYPALLACAALLGVRLAWGWYQRVALRPLGGPARPFGEFRFNDHLIWVLVLAIAAALVNPGPRVTLVTWNVLAVVVALYATRGLAVITPVLKRASPFFIAALIVIMLLMFAFALVGCTLLGVADTWIDFRRRRPPAMGATA